MYYDTNCTQVTIDKWNALMKGARRASYKRLVSRIKRVARIIHRAGTAIPQPLCRRVPADKDALYLGAFCY